MRLQIACKSTDSLTCSHPRCGCSRFVSKQQPLPDSKETTNDTNTLLTDKFPQRHRAALQPIGFPIIVPPLNRPSDCAPLPRDKVPYDRPGDIYRSNTCLSKPPLHISLLTPCARRRSRPKVGIKP